MKSEVIVIAGVALMTIGVLLTYLPINTLAEIVQSGTEKEITIGQFNDKHIPSTIQLPVKNGTFRIYFDKSGSISGDVYIEVMDSAGYTIYVTSDIEGTHQIYASLPGLYTITFHNVLFASGDRLRVYQTQMMCDLRTVHPYQYMFPTGLGFCLIGALVTVGGAIAATYKTTVERQI